MQTQVVRKRVNRATAEVPHAPRETLDDIPGAILGVSIKSDEIPVDYMYYEVCKVSTGAGLLGLIPENLVVGEDREELQGMVEVYYLKEGQMMVDKYKKAKVFIERRYEF